MATFNLTIALNDDTMAGKAEIGQALMHLGQKLIAQANDTEAFPFPGVIWDAGEHGNKVGRWEITQ